LSVAFEEAGEKETVDVLRLRVSGVAGVEICGIGFEEEGQRGGIGRRGTRAAREEERGNDVKK
jgi:hypothetical protein